MVVCFQKSKAHLAVILKLILSVTVLSCPVSAHEYKENYRPCGGGVINSKVIFEKKPIYPKAARKVQAEGKVNVMVRVDENGQVYEVRACSGHPLLRQSAVDAALQTRIRPTVLAGKAVKVGGVLVFEFKIEEKEGRLFKPEFYSTNQ